MKNIKSILKIFLILIAIHSFCVFLGLIFIPLNYLELFGFKPYHLNFFQAQGATFHLVMAVAYIIGAINPEKNSGIIVFSIIAKFIATVFLFSFYFFFDAIWAVLVSAIADFLMGILLVIIFNIYRKELESVKQSYHP
jgi:hypothetical protein